MFFLTSKKVARRLTEVFDFVWPTAAAIWNLRWQVGGLVAAYPAITEQELLGRFVTGSGIRGANLRRSCVTLSWDDQQQEFARFLLFEFCSLFEAWCEGCLQELGQPAALSKHLQFPTSTTAAGQQKGVGRAIAAITSTTSPVLSGALQGPLASNRKNSRAHLEQLLVCYRYFKEVRNSLIHSGGAASAVFLQAEAAYKQLTPASLGVKEIPAFNSYVLGQPLALSLRGVVGFGEVVLRLVCTLDLEFAQSSSAESVFVKRWKEQHGSSAVLIASDPHNRLERIRRMVRKLDLPTPKTSAAFDTWLKSNGLIS